VEKINYQNIYRQKLTEVYKTNSSHIHQKLILYDDDEPVASFGIRNRKAIGMKLHKA
jgi:hypothetical protein